MVITSEAQICQKYIKEGSASTSQVTIPEGIDKENAEDHFSKSTFCQPTKIASSSNRVHDQEINYEVDDKPFMNKDVPNDNLSWETNSVGSSQSDSLTIRRTRNHTSAKSKSIPAFKEETNTAKTPSSFLFIPYKSAIRKKSRNDTGVSKDDEHTIESKVKDTQSKHYASGRSREMDIPPERNLASRSTSRAIIINPLHLEETHPDSKVTSRKSSKTRAVKISPVTGTSQSTVKITKAIRASLRSAPELSVENRRRTNTTNINTNRQYINSKTVTYLHSEASDFVKEQVETFTSEVAEENHKENTLPDGSVSKSKSRISQHRKQIESVSVHGREKSLGENEKGNAVIPMTNRNYFQTNKSKTLLKPHIQPSCEKVENILYTSLHPVCMAMDIKIRSDSERINDIPTKHPDIAKVSLKRLVTSTPKLSEVRSSWQTDSSSHSSLRRPASQKTPQKKLNTENSTKMEVKNLVRSESYVIVGKRDSNSIKNERASESSVPPIKIMGKKSTIMTGTRNQTALQKQTNPPKQGSSREHSSNKITHPKVNDSKQKDITTSTERLVAPKSLPKTECSENTRYLNEENEVVIHPTIQAIRSKMRLIEKTRKEVERLSQATREIINESWTDDIQLNDDKPNIVQVKLKEEEKTKSNFKNSKSRTDVVIKQPYKLNLSTVETKRGKYTPRKIETAVKNSAPKNFTGANRNTNSNNNRDSKQKTNQSKSLTLPTTLSASRSSSGSAHTVKSRSQSSSARGSRPKALLSTISVHDKRKPSTNSNTSPMTGVKSSISNVMGVLGVINSAPKSEKNYIQLNIIRARERNPKNKVFSKKQSKTNTKSRSSVVPCETKETKPENFPEKVEKRDDTFRTTNELNKQPVNTFAGKSSEIIINMPNFSSVVGTGSQKPAYTSHKVTTTSHKPSPRTLALNRVPASTKFTSETSPRNGRERFSNEKGLTKRHRSSSDKSPDRQYGHEKYQNRVDEISPRNNNIQSVTKTFIASNQKVSSQNDSKVLLNRPRQNSTVSNRSRRTNNVRKVDNVKGHEKDQSETKSRRKNISSSENSSHSKRIPSRGRDEMESLFERGNSKTVKSPVARVSRKSGNLRLPGSRDYSIAPSNVSTTHNNPERIRNRSSTPGSKFRIKFENVASNSSEKKDNRPKSGSSEKRSPRTRTTAPELREMRKRDTVVSEVENKKINSASEVVSKFDHRNISGRSRFGKSDDLVNKSRNSQISNTRESSPSLGENSSKSKTPETNKRVYSSRLKNLTNPSSKFSSYTRAKLDFGKNSERKVKERDISQNRSDDTKTCDIESKEEDTVSRRSRSRTPSTFTKLVDNPILAEPTQIDSTEKIPQSQSKKTNPAMLADSVNDDAHRTPGDVKEKTATSRFSRPIMTSSMLPKDNFRRRDGSLTNKKISNNTTISDGKSRNKPETPKKEKSVLNVSIEISGAKNDTFRKSSNTSKGETKFGILNPKRFRNPPSKLRNNFIGKVTTSSDFTNNSRTITVRSQHRIGQNFNAVSKSSIKETEFSGVSKNVAFPKECSDQSKESSDTPDYVLDATGANPTHANIVALNIEEFALAQDPTMKKSDPKLTLSQHLKLCPMGSALERERKDDNDPLVIGDISHGIAVVIKPKSKIFSDNETEEPQKSIQDITKSLTETGDDTKKEKSKTILLDANQGCPNVPTVVYKGFNVQPHSTINAVVITDEESDDLSPEDSTSKTVFLSIDALGSLDTDDVQDSRSNSPLDATQRNFNVTFDDEQCGRLEVKSEIRNPHLTIRTPLVHAITILTRNKKEDEREEEEEEEEDEEKRCPSKVSSISSFIYDDDVDFLTASDSEKN